MEYKKSQSLSEQAADEILDMITIKKQFKVGDKLPNETELSSILNVSRTTLRGYKNARLKRYSRN